MSYDAVARNSLSEALNYASTQKILRVIWWNCGLTGLNYKHKRAINASERKKIEKILIKQNQVKNVIKKLMMQTDILVLGEFCWPGGIAAFEMEQSINQEDELRVFGFENLTHKISGSQMEFDNFVIYNKKILKVDNVSSCQNVGTKKRVIHYKAFQIVSFRHLQVADFSFELAVAHWNMRNGYGGDAYEFRRLKAAEKLGKRLSMDYHHPYKILVGDFNNEPYEAAFHWLETSRSRSYARDYKMLYNPFWRYMDGEHHTIFSSGNHDFKDNGAVFDSIMVNAEFLDQENLWKLEAEIIDVASLGYSVDKHDHQPVAMNFSK